MTRIRIALATEKDKNQLSTFFKHYKVKELIEHRVNCYTSHNFTVVAKDNDRIVGQLQWYIKEDPRAGLVEFEEVCVLKEYRGKGIGSLLIEYAIWSVKDYFKKIGIEPRKIFLFVGKNNEGARTFYERHGFRFVSEVGYLFSDTEMELFYSLDL
jgi:ribosomal protein S18 acetylase RimI-like enzyme